MKDFARDAWQITVQGLRVRIDYWGLHYRTSAPFSPLKDREGITRPNPNAEALASWFRFAVRHYGHPDATDDNPDPPFQPQKELALSAKEQRFINRQGRGRGYVLG